MDWPTAWLNDLMRIDLTNLTHNSASFSIMNNSPGEGSLVVWIELRSDSDGGMHESQYATVEGRGGTGYIRFQNLPSDTSFTPYGAYVQGLEPPSNYEVMSAFKTLSPPFKTLSPPRPILYGSLDGQAKKIVKLMGSQEIKRLYGRGADGKTKLIYSKPYAN